MTKKETGTKDKETVMSTQETVEIEQVEEEVNYDLIASGPLYVDPRHAQPGHHHTFVSDKPGEIEMYKRWGYEVVIDNFAVGGQNAATSTRFGSAVTVQSKCGQLLVYMAIPDAKYAKLQAHQRKKNQERESALGIIQGVSREHQYDQGKYLNEYKTK
jgi:hypothetical protein